LSNILSGLEELGFDKLSDVNVYGDKKNADAQANDVKKENSVQDKASQIAAEREMIFEKSYSCPCCYKDFKSKRVRTGKAQTLKPESDLRPMHKGIDTVKYDVVACPHCGYAALESSFSNLSQVQIKWIRDKITQNFSGIKEYGDIYTYDDAILRTKLAILCTVVKMGRDSEKAFSCLKLAWLYRGKLKELSNESLQEAMKLEDELKKSEFDNLVLAFEGFSAAYSNERFPIIGMNESGYLYLLAELARRINKPDESKRLISRLLQERNISHNVRDLVYDLKEKLK